MKDGGYHRDHLMLLCLAVADDGLLDLHRRVFADLDAVLKGGAKNDPARLSDGDTRGDVVGEEQLLDRHLLGSVFFDNGRKIRLDHGEAALDIGVCGCTDRTKGKRSHVPLDRLDHAPADDGKTGINAQNDHKTYAATRANGRISLLYICIHDILPYFFTSVNIQTRSLKIFYKNSCFFRIPMLK